jgi:hypothetical protein
MHGAGWEITGAMGSSDDVGTMTMRVVGSGHDESEMAMVPPPLMEGIDVAL